MDKSFNDDNAGLQRTNFVITSKANDRGIRILSLNWSSQKCIRWQYIEDKRLDIIIDPELIPKLGQNSRQLLTHEVNNK